MVCSKKRYRIEELHHGVRLNTWLTAVQEAVFVLGKIETKKVTSPRASHGPFSRRSYWTWKSRHSRMMPTSMFYSPIPQKVSGIEIRRKTKNQLGVRLLVCQIAPRRSVLPSLGGASAPKIVTGPVTFFWFTGTVISRFSMTRIRYRLRLWRWPTITFEWSLTIISRSIMG